MATAQDAVDESAQALRGTNEPDTRELLTGYGSVGEKMAGARQVIDRGGEIVEAYLPLDRVRQAVGEFWRTGARPTCVRWQPGQWS
ncbi:Imm1 family immunity protein [Saccharopolyspora sp. K220]|uniref:Imm1 family immunity protein n=1 Tax=Saccharopolyspora soli TaxID=2926618 RepID=UPI001F56081D|nr:Imm1 family immunity protein [Saccharopolyspora soli]MCI2424285.1 Imm1 family immunity protein [Saccharopolyspora soli]